MGQRKPEVLSLMKGKPAIGGKPWVKASLLQFVCKCGMR